MVRLPKIGAKTTIDMRLMFNELANGAYSVLDLGTENDQYTCEMSMPRKSTLATELLEYAEETYRGEGVSLLTLLGEAYPFFHPFGPHIDMSANDSIKIIDFNNETQIDDFGNWYDFKAEIVPSFQPSFNTSGGPVCMGGGFKIGSLYNFYLPKMTLTEDYKVYANRYGNNTNLNHNLRSSQHKTLKLEWDLQEDGCAAILLELVRNIRGIKTILNAGPDWTPFGLDEGTGDHQIMLKSGKITIVSKVGSWYKVSCEVALCR